MPTKSYTNAQKKYDKYNTKNISIKLNYKTDTDIINWLKTKDNQQKAIKNAIRKELETSSKHKSKETLTRNLIHGFPSFEERAKYNTHSIVSGVPGTGKTFSIKKDILNILLNSDDCVFIFDFTGEYTNWAKHIKLNPNDLKIYKFRENYPVNLMDEHILKREVFSGNLFYYVAKQIGVNLNILLMQDLTHEYLAKCNAINSTPNFSDFLKFIDKESEQKYYKEDYIPIKKIIEELSKWEDYLGNKDWNGYDFDARMIIFDVSDYTSIENNAKSNLNMDIISSLIAFNCMNQYAEYLSKEDKRLFSYIEDCYPLYKETAITECLIENMFYMGDYSNLITLIIQDIADMPTRLVHDIGSITFFKQPFSVVEAYQKLFNKPLPSDITSLDRGDCFTVNIEKSKDWQNI